MGKTCLKLFLTGMILFIIGVAGLAALEINGYDIEDISDAMPGSHNTASSDNGETTFVVNEAVIVDNGTGGHIFQVNENDVNKLEVNVNMENFYVIEGDTFEVVGYNIDPEYLNCTVKDGCLYVSYSPKVKLFNIYYDNIAIGNITVTVPQKVLESADFTVKAGSLSVSNLETQNLSLNMAAGDTNFFSVAVQERSHIKMTAGSCVFEDCNFNNSNINMTAGDMTYNLCRLTGGNNIKMTAGELYMGLIGRRSDYNIKVDRTAGEVYIDGYEYGTDYAVNTMATTVYHEPEAYAEEHADGVHEQSVHQEQADSVHEEHVKSDLNIKITAGNCSISFIENE